MSKGTATFAEDVSSRPPTPTHEDVQRQIQSTLASPSFHGSKRCQQFLEYVCGRALAGDAGALKERAVAIEVFGRHPDSGLGEDTIVRVGAREVRKRLAQYYASADGLAAPVVIELPLGSYVPEFRFAQRPKVAAATLPPAEPEAAANPPRAATESLAAEAPLAKAHRWPWVAGSVILLSLAVLAAMRWSVGPKPNGAFEAFWAPVLSAETPLLIGVGHPIVYMPSRRVVLLNEQRLPPTPFPVQRPLALAPKEVDGSDMVAVQNQFVGFGDMVAGNDVSQMLARRGHGVRLMMASSIPFADLRHSPVYLIGSLSNRWTSELGQGWRFQFAWTPERTPVIRDTQDPKHRQWTVAVKEDGSMPDDYCLIARIPHSQTGGMLIVSAGIKQFGTEAAGRLLADPADFDAVLSKLPAGWENKNVQLVLHARVIGNTPTQPDVVAYHVW